jgi:hypothetical protein
MLNPPSAGRRVEEALERNAPNLLADYLYLWETAAYDKPLNQLGLLSRQADIRRVTGASSVNLRHAAATNILTISERSPRCFGFLGQLA